MKGTTDITDNVKAKTKPKGSNPNIEIPIIGPKIWDILSIDVVTPIIFPWFLKSTTLLAKLVTIPLESVPPMLIIIFGI